MVSRVGKKVVKQFYFGTAPFKVDLTVSIEVENAYGLKLAILLPCITPRETLTHVHMEARTGMFPEGFL